MRCMTSNGICRGFAFKYGKFPLPLRYRTALSVPKVPTMYSNYVVYKMNTCLLYTSYSEFYDVTEGWGREVVESPLVETDGNWSVDFEDFEEKVKQAKIFFLCSPHNPLGIVWELSLIHI